MKNILPKPLAQGDSFLSCLNPSLFVSVFIKNLNQVVPNQLGPRQARLALEKNLPCNGNQLDNYIYGYIYYNDMNTNV